MSTDVSWSFRDRSFLTCLAASLGWHLFWFCSLQIVVNSPPARLKIRPKIVSIGTVLDDTLFRTLVNERPEFSKSIYRRLSDYSPQADLPVKTMERQTTGEVVSLSSGGRSGFLRRVVGGEKATAPFEFLKRITIRYPHSKDSQS